MVQARQESGAHRVDEAALGPLAQRSAANVPPAPWFSPPGSESSQHKVNALIENLLPQQWLSPSLLNWNDWDFMLNGHTAPTALSA